MSDDHKTEKRIETLEKSNDAAHESLRDAFTAIRQLDARIRMMEAQREEAADDRR